MGVRVHSEIHQNTEPQLSTSVTPTDRPIHLVLFYLKLVKLQKV